MSNDMLQLPYVKVGGYLNYFLYSPDRPSPIAYSMYSYQPYCEAKKLAEMAMDKGIQITITPNSTKDRGFAYLAWCDACQDGLNASNEDANDWVRMHTKKVHGLFI